MCQTNLEMSGFHVIALIQEMYARFFFCHSPDASGFGIILSRTQAGSLWRKRRMLDLPTGRQ